MERIPTAMVVASQPQALDGVQCGNGVKRSVMSKAGPVAILDDPRVTDGRKFMMVSQVTMGGSLS